MPALAKRITLQPGRMPMYPFTGQLYVDLPQGAHWPNDSYFGRTNAAWVIGSITKTGFILGLDGTTGKVTVAWQDAGGTKQFSTIDIEAPAVRSRGPHAQLPQLFGR